MIIEASSPYAAIVGKPMKGKPKAFALVLTTVLCAIASVEQTKIAL